MMGEDARGLQAVILVGGRGTRLGALTESCPKPLIDVGGKPFLEYLIRNLVRHGFTEILLLAGYLGEQLHRLAENADNLNCRITYLCEPAPAGTAGALLHAREHLSGKFLLLNGDSFFDINYLDLLQIKTKQSIGAAALREMADTGRYGQVILEGNSILDFAEKQSGGGPGLINGGIYWLDRTIIEWIDKTPAALEFDVLPQLAKAGLLAGKSYSGAFIDIGIPADLAKAQSFVPQLMRRPAVFLDRDGVLNADTGYPHLSDQIQWTEGAAAAVKRFNDAGYLVFVVTNQAGVAHGHYDEAAIKRLHHWMSQELMKSGAHIDDWRYCPFHPEGKVEAYRRAHPWRKPEAGMLLDLMTHWQIDSAHSFLIGDKQSDLDAAARAGIPGHLFSGGSLAEFANTIIAASDGNPA